MSIVYAVVVTLECSKIRMTPRRQNQVVGTPTYTTISVRLYIETESLECFSSLKRMFCFL